MNEEIFIGKSEMKKDFPDPEEFVAVRITELGELGHVCQLLDYGNAEALIIQTDVGRRRRTKSKATLQVGVVCLARVLRVDREKNYIDLTRRHILPEDEGPLIFRHLLAEIPRFLFRQVSKKLQLPDEFFESINTSLEEKYGHSYFAFLQYFCDSTLDIFAHLAIEPHIKQSIYFHLLGLKNFSTKEFPTPLSVVIQLGMVDFLKLMLKNGCDPNSPTQGTSHLRLALTNHRPDLALILLENGAYVNVAREDLIGFSILNNYVDVSINLIKYDQSKITLHHLMHLYNLPTNIPELPWLLIKEFCWKQKKNFMMFLYQQSFQKLSTDSLSLSYQRVLDPPQNISKIIVFSNADLCRLISLFL